VIFELGFTPATLRLLADFKYRIRGLSTAIYRGAQKTARELERQTKENITAMHLIKSGALRRSVEAGVLPFTNGTVTIYVGSVKGAASAYAEAQETGKLITPKNGQWLAIPVGPALTAGGIARYKSPLDVPAKLRFQPIDANTALLVATGGWSYTIGRSGYVGKVQGARKKDAKRGVVWFILVKSVRLPATNWLSKSVKGGQQLLQYNVQESVYNHLRS
jgi:hypothetical protein